MFACLFSLFLSLISLSLSLFLAVQLMFSLLGDLVLSPNGVVVFFIRETLGDDTSSNSFSSFSESKLLSNLHGEREVESKLGLDVITSHSHLIVSQNVDLNTGVSGSHEELWSITVWEWFFTTSFLFGEDIEVTLHISENLLGSWLRDDLSSLDVISADTSQEETNVISSLTVVEGLFEGFDTGDSGLDGLLSHSENFDFLTDLQLSSVDGSGDDGSSSWNLERSFDGEEEWLIEISGWWLDVVVHDSEKFFDFLDSEIRVGAIQGAESGSENDFGVFSIVVVFAEEFSNFHFDKFVDFWVWSLVALVDENDDVGDSYLSAEEDMFSGLGHRSIGGGDKKNACIHLGSTSNHVLDVIDMAWTVDVSVVTCFCLVLDGGCVDSDTSGLFFWCLIDLVVIDELREFFLSENLGDGSSQGSFSVIDMSNSSNVQMDLISLELSKSLEW